MLYYKVTGDAAAVSLLNRLSALGQSAKTIRGRLAALTPISLTAEAKKRAQIPPKASFYAFAYPLDCMAADTATLLQAVIGSVSRLDDESFFFFLLGGFCYFDERKQFLQANAISLSRRFSVIEHGEEVMVSSGELVFDGPYALGDNVADALRAADRFAPPPPSPPPPMPPPPPPPAPPPPAPPPTITAIAGIKSNTKLKRVRRARRAGPLAAAATSSRKEKLAASGTFRPCSRRRSKAVA